MFAQQKKMNEKIQEDLSEETYLYVMKYEYLKSKGYEEVSPYDFYRDIFPKGTFQEKGDNKNKVTRGNKKGNGVLLQITEKGGMHRIVTDDLEEILRYKGEKNVIMSPISYFGRRRTTHNASYIYALAFDLDGQGMRELETTIKQMNVIYLDELQQTFLPKPTYLVLSGHGLHLYYVLDNPMPMKPYLRRELGKLKEGITSFLWNMYVTKQWERPQYQPITQGFRVVGSASKLGADYPVRAFKIGPKWALNDLKAYIPDTKSYAPYRSDFDFVDITPIEKAKELWPDWYERKVVKKLPSKKWKVKRALYDWWLGKIPTERRVGHRYFCMLTLVMFAVKCGIPFEELKKDAYSLIEDFDRGSPEDNHFTKKDVDAALKIYGEGAEKYTRNYISKITAIEIPENKRNYRTQKDHLKIARGIKELRIKLGEVVDGRPKGSKNKKLPKKELVLLWRKNNPNGKKVDCHRETGITRPTIDKYWNET